MKYSDIPAKVPVPFANSGSKNTIPTPSQIGITAGAASLTDGFPPLTFTPVAAGGVPPSGKDFNGILYRLSENTRWSNAGSFYNFDSTFASSIGGYPKGAIVLRSDGAGFWQSTVDDNTTDPESTSASGWVPIIRVPTVSTGTATAYSVADNVGAYTTGAIYKFVAHTANTGSATVDFGAGAVSIHDLSGSAPSAGAIAANNIVHLRYNGTAFTLQNPYIDANTFSSLAPAGTVSYLAMSTAPSGWLKANGAAISRTTYSSLFNAISTTFGAGDGSTTFNVPDLRGEFARGFDDGRGVDSGRTFGSSQADEFRSHTHTYNAATSGGGATGSGGIIEQSGATTGPTGGNETRPRNIALLACIKY